MQEWIIENDQDGVLVMQDLIREGIRQNFYNGFTVAQVFIVIYSCFTYQKSVS